MVGALWPGTWGYYLTQFIGLGAGRLAEADLDWARDFAGRWVRPGGPLPAIRVGRQPYGVLPVTALRRFSASGPDAGRFSRLRDLLAGLRDVVWRPALAEVPRVGRGTDPNAELVDVLRSDAVGEGFAVRRAMGPQYVQHLSRFLGEDLEALGFWARQSEITSALPGRVGLGFRPANGGLVWEPATRTAGLPLLPADHRGMIDALLADDLAGLMARTPSSLLEAWLRFGLLREYARAAAGLLADQDHPLGALLRDAELVDLGPGSGSTSSFARQLDQPVPGPSPEQTVRARLEAQPSGPLAQVRGALADLAATPGPALDRALRDTLGITTHRLDAWVTGYATARLAELRARRPAGLQIGGYGWLENLLPEPRNPVDPLPDEPGPLTAAVDDPGFIHAPSLGQAGAAALLRNAHLAHGAARDGPYAINLSSERVRRAVRLFDGVRQGQSLGALLGYDVERQLHEAGLDHLLDDVRREAPPADAASGEDAVRRRVLLDGLELHRQWEDMQEHLLDHISEDGMSAGDRQKMIMILKRLDAAIDAAADAVTAENVFQFARGNLARSGGSLDEIATGKAPPPSLEFMRTPRTGTAITHRVAVACPVAGDRTAGWAATTPRALAEPALDAWLSRLLGPATGIEVVVEVLGVDGVVQARHAVPLPDLGLAALDLVWIAGDDGALDRAGPARVRGGRARPERAAPDGNRAGAARSRRCGWTSPPAPIGPSAAWPTCWNWPAGPELCWPAPDRWTAPTCSRPTRPRIGGSTWTSSRPGRRRLTTRLSELHDQLQALLAATPPPTVGRVREVLGGLAQFGITGATTPLSGS